VEGTNHHFGRLNEKINQAFASIYPHDINLVELVSNSTISCKCINLLILQIMLLFS